jgi:hypothetical protein
MVEQELQPTKKEAHSVQVPDARRWFPKHRMQMAASAQEVHPLLQGEHPKPLR